VLGGWPAVSLIKLILSLQQIGVLDFETLSKCSLVAHMNTVSIDLQWNGSESAEDIFTTFKIFKFFQSSKS
jgi:hypothetical protein